MSSKKEMAQGKRVPREIANYVFSFAIKDQVQPETQSTEEWSPIGYKESPVSAMFANILFLHKQTNIFHPQGKHIGQDSTV